MSLPRQTVPIPLTGGLAGKGAPLVIPPGSYLTLDNVRHERTGEWRRRHGWAQSGSDTLPNTGGRQAVRGVELPGGGFLALTEMSSDVNTCARLYSPTAATRWTIPPQFQPLYGGSSSPGAGQASLPLWSRTSISYANGARAYMTMAIGNGLQLTAWTDSSAPTQATAMFKTVAENEAQGLPFTFGSTSVTTTAIRPRAVYFAGSPGVFMLLWIEGANLLGQTWNGNGGSPSAVVTLKTNVASGSGLDAIIYSGSNVTVAYQDSGNKLHVLEVTSSLGVATDVATSVTATQCVQLFPEPDGSGVRLAGTATTNLQQVTRFNSSGTVLTATNIGTLSETVDSFAGVAVNGGGGHICVFHTTAGNVWASKTVTAPTAGTLSALVSGDPAITIDSNGWREPGTDAMHWIAGLHVGNPGSALTPGTDLQHNYYEMALEYGGTNVVANQFSEPQARLIPLQAGPPTGMDTQGVLHPGSQAQVIRTAASAFSLPLMRISKVDTGNAGGIRYAVDRWDVLHLNGSNLAGLNLGHGVRTKTASYLPSGHLLQTVDGQQIVGHGASAQPYQIATLTPGTGGSLGVTPPAACTYFYIVVIEMVDEAGNIWRSTPSIPKRADLTSIQNKVSVTFKVPSLESAWRRRTVKVYRTFANGSVYFLDFQQTDTVQATQSLSYDDLTADVSLGTQLSTGLSSGDGGEEPATITPAFLHVALFDGRLWGIERDFPTRVRFSKPILQGAIPEFPANFTFDVLDELGPFTGLAACDDKLVFFKSPLGVYYVQQGGPANDGSGNQYSIVRVSSEVGLLLGQPYVSTGAEVYFGARQDGGAGIYRVNRSLEIDWVGAPIDQYLAQSEINTPDVLMAATYSDKKNEIRFMGQQAQYVFDRIHNLWVRDTFPSLSGTPPTLVRTVAGVDMMFINSGGIVWTEGDDTNLNDPSGGAYVGRIRSAWLRLAQMGGYMRLYFVKLLLDVTGGTAPQQQLLVYFNDSDTPVPVMLSPANVARGEWEAATPAVRKCGAFSVELDLAAGDIGVRLDGWSAIVGIKEGPRKLGSGKRWQ